MGKPRVPHPETPPKQPYPLTSAKPRCQRNWTSLKGPPFLLLPGLLRAPLSAAMAWVPTHWAALPVPVRHRAPAQGWTDPRRVTFPDCFMEHPLTLLHLLPRHKLWRWRISTTAFAKLKMLVLEGQGLVRRHCPFPEEWRPELHRVKPAQYGSLGLNWLGTSCALGQRWGSIAHPELSGATLPSSPASRAWCPPTPPTTVQSCAPAHRHHGGVGPVGSGQLTLSALGRSDEIFLVQPSRPSPAQPQGRPSETRDVKAPPQSHRGALNIMVTEQGAQTLGLQAVWTGAGPGTRMKYVGGFPMAETKV